jgi:hypothetical protein
LAYLLRKLRKLADQSVVSLSEAGQFLGFEPTDRFFECKLLTPNL